MELTLIPPPTLTQERAVQIYFEPFLRAIELITINHLDGDVCEFGTWYGWTARMIAEFMKAKNSKAKLYLYDSWEGFPEFTENDAACPEAQAKLWNPGDLNTGAPNDVSKEIERILNHFVPTTAIKGFYDQTLPDSLPKSIAFAHVDCDLYMSTRHVLSSIKDRLCDGAVVMFDEYNNNLASDSYGERKAKHEVFPWNLEEWFTYGPLGKAFIYHR